jgi:hypothetical protein
MVLPSCEKEMVLMLARWYFSVFSMKGEAMRAA